MLRKLVPGFLVVSLVAVALVAHAKMEFNVKYESGWWAFNECDPSQFLSGEVKYRVLSAFTEDGSGKIHHKMHMNAKVSAAGYWWGGMPTGVVYQGKDVSNVEDKFDAGWQPPYKLTGTSSIILHGSDGSKIKLHGNYHVLVDEDGNWNWLVDNYRVTCN